MADDEETSLNMSAFSDIVIPQYSPLSIGPEEEEERELRRQLPSRWHFQWRLVAVVVFCGAILVTSSLNGGRNEVGGADFSPKSSNVEENGVSNGLQVDLNRESFQAKGDSVAGRYVSLSADGTTIASMDCEFGILRVSRFDDDSNTWKQIGQEIQTSYYMHSFALSSNGRTLASLMRGRLHVLQLGEDKKWIKKGESINFTNFWRQSLDISWDGNIIAIGGPGESRSGKTISQVRVFKFNERSELWRQFVESLEKSADENDRTVSLSSDGHKIAINSPHEHGGPGCVRVFQHNGIEWMQVGSSQKEKSACNMPGDSLSLSAAGDVIAVGDINTDKRRGQVKVFKYNTKESEWIQLGGVISGDRDHFYFGSSVSLSATGSSLVVGDGIPSSDPNQGSYFRVFDLVDGSWVQRFGASIPGRMIPFEPTNGVAPENKYDISHSSMEMGRAVSISSDGTTIVVTDGDKVQVYV